ncbi:hypothetical protein B0H12DRAFT_1070514 [Mycena haematopus]|nr:hypothetical protein B0H12DRAFT_1070514 [Mycena haematopus]
MDVNVKKYRGWTLARLVPVPEVAWLAGWPGGWVDQVHTATQLGRIEAQQGRPPEKEYPRGEKTCTPSLDGAARLIWCWGRGRRTGGGIPVLPSCRRSSSVATSAGISSSAPALWVLPREPDRVRDTKCSPGAGVGGVIGTGARTPTLLTPELPDRSSKAGADEAGTMPVGEGGRTRRPCRASRARRRAARSESCRSSSESGVRSGLAARLSAMLRSTSAASRKSAGVGVVARGLAAGFGLGCLENRLRRGLGGACGCVCWQRGVWTWVVRARGRRHGSAGILASPLHEPSSLGNGTHDAGDKGRVGNGLGKGTAGPVVALARESVQVGGDLEGEVVLEERK